MQHYKTLDPRTNVFEWARRMQLAAYCRSHGHPEINENMPKPVMVARMQQVGLRPTIADFPKPRYGINDAAAAAHAIEVTSDEPAVDADADLIRQWEMQNGMNGHQLPGPERDPPRPPLPPQKPNDIAELRAACKKRGIKLARTDTKETMKAKLYG